MSLVRFRPEAPNGYADLAHLVERHLAKVEVASSSLVIRSIGRLTPFKRPTFLKSLIRHHSQVVRQRSAKPLCPSSNLGGASKKLLFFRTRVFYPFRKQWIFLNLAGEVPFFFLNCAMKWLVVEKPVSCDISVMVFLVDKSSFSAW